MAVTGPAFIRDFGGPAQFTAIWGHVIGVLVPIDPPSIASIGGGHDFVTVPGVQLGDAVIGMSFDQPVPMLVAQAAVTDTDTVRIQYNNLSAAAVDIGPCNLRLVIARANV